MPVIDILTAKETPRLVYVLQYLGQHPLAPDNVSFQINAGEYSTGTCIGYGVRAGKFFMPALELCFEKQPQDINLDTIRAVPARFGQDILFGITTEQPANGTPDFLCDRKFAFDIFESLFFHISRMEEWAIGERDAHDRIPSEAMFLVKHKLEKIPVADHLVLAFYRVLGFAIKSQPAKVHITHDIDIPCKFPNGIKVVKSLAGVLLKQASIRGFLQVSRQIFDTFILKKKDPYNVFDWLLEWSGVGERTAYFMAGGSADGLEGFYNIEDKNIHHLLRMAQQQNYTIGLHPSYNTYKNEALFKNEKLRLESVLAQEITQTRQHFLRWQFPETPRIIENLQFENDATLGFADRIGFRCATGFAYRLYDFENERPYIFRETPMIAMDVALLRMSGFQPRQPGRQHKMLQRAAAIMQHFVTKNRENTHITFNLHNSTFDPVYLDAERLMRIVEEAIDHLSNRRL